MPTTLDIPADLRKKLEPLYHSVRNLQSLADQMRGPHGVIPFVGAGLSVPYNYPTWRDFLLEEAKIARVESQTRALLESDAPGKFEDAAQLVWDGLADGGPIFRKALETIYGPKTLPDPLSPNTPASLLPRLCDGPVLTTNYDYVLERVHEAAGARFEPIVWGALCQAGAASIGANMRPLIKLHGDALHGGIVLTSKQYDDAYGDPSAPGFPFLPDTHPLPTLLGALFLQFRSPLLFLGCSLEDDRTMNVLQKTAKVVDGLMHYAVVEAPSSADEFARRRSLLDARGIAPIWYTHGEHDLLLTILQYLADIRGTASAASNKPWNVPFRRNDLFTGREDVLDKLHAALASGKAAALTQAISGLGGIGKTQTAVEYAYRRRDEYSAILWMRSESETTLTTSFSEIARLLALPEADAQDQNITVSAVKRWLQDHTGWLLILDNADDVKVAHAALPSGLNGHVLLTTRATALTGIATPIRIIQLSPDEGADFLLRRANILSPDEEDHAAALTLSEEMGGLPLALDQAGAYIEETPSTPRKYLALYRTCRGALLKQGGTLSATDHAPVFITFSLAFKKVQKVHPVSADLLRLCAFLAPDAIPEEILTKGAATIRRRLFGVFPGGFLFPQMRNDKARDEIIKGAHRWSLLEHDAKVGLLSVHRVVQVVIQESMMSKERHTWAIGAVLAVNGAFPDPEFSNWPLCEGLLPHARACAAHITEYDIKTRESAYVLNQTGSYLYSRALYSSAEPFYQYALAIAEQTLGPEHPNTAGSLNNLALLYKAQGNYAAAEPRYQRVLAIAEKSFGAEDPNTAVSLNNLAELHRAHGDHAAAEPLYQRALAIDEKVYGLHHPFVATDINNLAELYRTQGDYTTAEPLYLRALAIAETVLGPEHPQTAMSINNLATLYVEQGDYAVAEPLYKRTLAIWQKVLGPEHPSTTLTLANYAYLLRAMGRNAEAAVLEARAAAGRAEHERRNAV